MCRDGRFTPCVRRRFRDPSQCARRTGRDRSRKEAGPRIERGDHHLRQHRDGATRRGSRCFSVRKSREAEGRRSVKFRRLGKSTNDYACHRSTSSVTANPDNPRDCGGSVPLLRNCCGRTGNVMMQSKVPPTDTAKVPLVQFVGYFLRLGTVGFGGPIALAGHMQQDLVDERGWIRKEDYVEGLALAQLAPGPLAAQPAIYLGYVRAGLLGATAVGVAFVLPSFLMVLGLSAAYVRYGGLPWMQGMFYGIGAAVIGIIARSAFRMTRLTLGRDKLLWVIFAVLATSTAWTSREIVWLFLLGGIVNLLAKAFPNRLPARSAMSMLLPGMLATFGVTGTLLQIFVYFA